MTFSSDVCLDQMLENIVNLDVKYHVLLSTGHTDVVMGALILNNDEVAEKLRFLQNGEKIFV
jgi:hypothetical protein